MILSNRSLRKPFMIDITITRAATARAMATNEITAISATPPWARIERR